MAVADHRRFAEQLLAFALQSDEYAFVLLDRDARIVFWNAQAQRVFGCDEREILGEPLSRLFVVEDLARRLDRHEIEIARNDGSAEDDRIVVKATVEVDEVVVRVVDNGMGIPHDVLPRIFDLFTRTDSARLQAREGLGIGLSLVRDLVAAHGGSVQVQSDGPSCGSTFTVRLPLHLANS